ncbi:hypothetical protein I5G63_gp088 [Mycobacterium phage Imvubu]|uniref:Uncharacterized protein n=1 Tax=Mycobacterium phage Imvubu TaxID=2686233 RepID=A0A6B9LDR6_9CAUD|nr:hypothetical protein I5G63_gp088 [Mycobacterium phage Imvubu]QHB37828.1 hypothetical protein PBI_IMVUBU_88 [Mycobacterium phage Imvubu]
MTHQPEWVRIDGETWEDANQPDSDQFSGTSEEWLAVLAAEGIRPPQHRLGHPPYAPEVVIVDTGVLGSVYRISGETLAMRSRRTGEWQATGQ